MGFIELKLWDIGVWVWVRRFELWVSGWVSDKPNKALITNREEEKIILSSFHFFCPLFYFEMS